MRRFFAGFILVLSLTACSTAFKVEPVLPQYRDPSLKYFVENHGKDNRHLERIIASELQKHGLNVSYGYGNQRPANFDILVVYEDRWQWDMTNYLIHMRIDLRSPATHVLLGTGSSYQTSLARKSEDEVIKNIVSGMLDKK